MNDQTHELQVETEQEKRTTREKLLRAQAMQVDNMVKQLTVHWRRSAIEELAKRLNEWLANNP